MDLASPMFAFLAGLSSIASPCIFPLLPVVAGAAASRHRFGPLALTAGIALSFLVLGMFVATVGFAAGLDGDAFRMGAAIVLVVLGSALLVPRLHAWMSLALAPFSARAECQLGRLADGGLAAQFGIGLLLGAVWTPCVGPTLGAASVLAAQRQHLIDVAITMLLFAIGTALPLLGLGFLSRELMLRWRGRLLSAGRAGKIGLGVALVLLGVAVLRGYDRAIEAALLDIAPDWLTRLSTAF